jgi:redox-sensitive bicupin YhaK (pirin superfamily)
MTFEVRRAASRFTTSAEGRTTRHSFSFDRHYDPANVGHAVLVAHNDDLVAPGFGYDSHPHRDTEIVTWVLEGSLVHQDTHGHAGVLGPGLVQAMSAGRGVVHSERNDAPGADRPTRFVQMWVRPDEPGLEPSYSQRDVSGLLGPGSSAGSGELVPLASGGSDAAVRIHAAGATLHVARLSAGQAVLLPQAPYLHLFVARGGVDLEGAGVLQEADAARLVADGGQRVSASGDAEVLVWEMHTR